MKYPMITLMIASLGLAAVAVAQQEDAGYENSAHKGQNSGQRRGPKGNPADRLTRELGLSEDQAAQLESIFEQARADREALRNAGHEEQCAVRAETESQIAGVLTADQLAEMEELRAERDNRRQGQQDGQGRRGGRNGRGPIDCEA